MTIEAICERAGVKKGSFYYFFDSKSDLALAAIKAWWHTRHILVKEWFRPEVAPLDRIGKYLDYVMQRQLDAYGESGQVPGCPFFTLGAEICTQDEEIRALVQEIMNCVAVYFEDAIREAQANGELDEESVASKARLLWGFYEGTLTRARIENNPELIRNLHADVFELLGASPKLAVVA
ncbi:MAG: TetR/AcrR family transcriptional regulator [Methylacidiphilales bacterium]|nr:TetR/AcrR family transcriptional regulator [Candidatus Methylacidiphilales bacterium]